MTDQQTALGTNDDSLGDEHPAPPGAAADHDGLPGRLPDLGDLLEPPAEQAGDPAAVRCRLDFPSNVTVQAIAELLDVVLVRDPDAARWSLAVAGTMLGTTSRRHLKTLLDPPTRDGGSLGDAEQAWLPGESNRYEALRFVCDTVGCTYRVWRTHLDLRDPPRCAEPGHGELRLVT
ncbi:hypothetical protein ACWGKQ_03295 [Streptomyces sp. NPDC054770]